MEIRAFIIFLTVGFGGILLNLWVIQIGIRETNRLLRRIAGEKEEEEDGRIKG